eukprot:CAMPEP_0113670988 /NCGR_PEP_ID=MMETSP0038_2-20120614/5452_1 /TAXON_ID=2898 /ORGANISM="Cryptomonas paramecium" /LENGTH=38 /DNA_ID=CAMNT_0000587085 /DNA_START=42 /DNA_END=155 /DNA_ORIENTATION=+ /assembly_acc=CAM_ASM_000170
MAMTSPHSTVPSMLERTAHPASGAIDFLIFKGTLPRWP